jgi:hypothetical protein
MSTDIKQRYIEDHTLRLEASYRGGGIEIDAEDYIKVEGALVSAYQNYLGGGLLGAVQSDNNLDYNELTPIQQRRLERLSEALKEYYHNITNEGHDEWSESDYESNQNRPASAY